MSTSFPTPFSGIKFAAETEDIAFIIDTLLSCGHLHNFAVELESDPPRIWVSESGKNCLVRNDDE